MRESVFSYGDRTAVVTGGSGSIGRAICTKFTAAGLKVARLRSGRGEPQLYADDEDSISSISDWTCDVTDPSEIADTFRRIQARHGSIDILVNSAGLLSLSSIEDTTENHWDTVLDVNLKGAFFCIQKCIPYLKTGQAPRIINISSNAGRMGGYANGLAYSASKGGLISLTYGLARRLAPEGITVNCVAPGTIASKMSDNFEIEEQRRLLERFPLGRFGTPEEVACAVCYFAALESAFTTGAVLDVNGGMFMG